MCKPYFAITDRRMVAGLVVGAVLSLSSTFAQAGPCSEDIAQFEAAVRQSANNPFAGLMAPQSIGAQLDRQPTAVSMKQAEERLKSKCAATMARGGVVTKDQPTSRPCLGAHAWLTEPGFLPG